MKDERITDSRFILHPSSFILCAGLVIGTFLLMLAWTWAKWPDPLVDFGRELYVPWQITEGKSLYQDLAYFNGPLSPYFNAMMFALLGTSLRTLVLVNVVLLAGLTWMLWRLVAQLADRFAATVACVVMLTVFSFIQLVPTGNYNFITPYSHELTHGLILSVAGMLLLRRFIDRRRSRYAGAIGLVLGLIFLTKTEVMLAAGVSLAAGVILCRPSRKALVALGIGFMIPPLLALILLSLKMPVTTALRGVMGSWMYVLNPQLRQMEFYRKVMGTLDLAANIRSILLCCVVYVLAITPGVIVSRFMTDRFIEVLVGGILAVIVVFWRIDLSYWQSALHGFTILVPAIAVGATVLAIRRPLPERILRAAFSIFAALLLLKILFDVRVMHYGFALALPAALLVLAAGVGWLPGWLQERGYWGEGLRATLLPLIAVFIFVHLLVYDRQFADKTAVVGAGADAFRADPAGTRAPRGLVVNRVLQHLSTLPPDTTLAVLPEGAMINYLARRVNPTPYITLMPPEIAMFGHEQILASFATHPPDYILIQRMSAVSEYNLGDFETGFGAPIHNWIQAHYDSVPVPQWDDLPPGLLTLLKKR